jgi:hypothetical protein
VIVGDKEFELFGRHASLGVFRVVGERHGKSIAFEYGPNQQAAAGVVINNQDTCSSCASVEKGHFSS